MWTTGALHADIQLWILSLSQLLNLPNPSCLCLPISQVHFVNNECNRILPVFEKLTFTSQLSIPRRAFSTQSILASIMHQLYWEYSPAIAAVPSSTYSECHLRESRLKLVSDCPFKCKFFHISASTCTSHDGGFRSEVQKGLKMSPYWIIPGFMHRNMTKRG